MMICAAVDCNKMASISIPRPIFQKGFAGSSNNLISVKRTAGSWFSTATTSRRCAHHVISGSRVQKKSSPPPIFESDGSIVSCKTRHMISDSRVQKDPSPWLMLPPVFGGDGSIMSYKFYSLAENKVLTLEGKEIADLMPKRKSLSLRFRGSSHGWLALINPDNLDLFLHNPLSGRHLKLPPLHNLPNYPDDYLHVRDVDKVILSSSPDEDGHNCIAMIIYNNICGLAFCCPGHSKEWTSIGDMRWWDECREPVAVSGYVDCVYSARQKVFFCLAESGKLESWDLRDPSSPRVMEMMNVDRNKISPLRDLYSPRVMEMMNVDKNKIPPHLSPYEFLVAKEHLVVAEQDLFLVTQYTMDQVGPDGSWVSSFEEDWMKYPYMTVDFNVHKYDPDEKDLRYVDGSSLGGLALFIGFHNHSVALRVGHEYPQLKPNSIYFTDTMDTEPLCDYDDDDPFGGHDIGIFNYEDKTMSPCYYPCDVRSLKRITPPPMWFFPSSPV